MDEVAQDIWFDNWEKGLDLWEISRHYARTDTTTSLLWFDSEDLPEVEVNRFGVRVEDDGGLAVPPLSAKPGSEANTGRIPTSSRTRSV